MQTEGVKGGGRHRNRLREWNELQQETEAINTQLKAINRDQQREGEILARWNRQAEAGVCVCVHVCVSLLDILDLHAGRAATA